MAKGDPGEVFTITDAQRALSVEQAGRTRRYLISMGIRTACVIAAIFVPGWPRWVFVAGAVVLPYFAVVVANAGRENDEPGESGVTPQDRHQIPSSGTAIGDDGHRHVA
jgi:type III secretory pathway component EscV